MLKTLLASVAGLSALLGVASASSIIADEVTFFFDSGAGPIAGPYGGPPSPNPVSLDNAVDGDSSTFVSLPTGSIIVVKFNTGVVVDGVGFDLFIDEVGNGQEDGAVEVSQNGTDFFSVGTAFGNQTSNFDLSAVFQQQGLAFVQFVRITGLDNGGSSPGFDVSLVEGLEGSTAPAPEVPLPAAALLFAPVLGFLARRRKR